MGFLSDGCLERAERCPGVAETFGLPADPATIRIVSFAAPLLAIAGGAMARSAHVAGGILMRLAAAGMWHAFGFGVFTMFPRGFCTLGGVRALAARRPDPH